MGKRLRSPNPSSDTTSHATGRQSRPQRRTASRPTEAEPLTAQEESLSQTLFELAPDAILVVDDTGHIVLVNHQTEALFGYLRADLIGRSIECLLPERFKSTHVGHRTAYTAEPHTRPMGADLKLFGRRVDGSEFPVEVSLAPLNVGLRQRIVAIVRDVTAQRQLERERAEQAERLRLQADLINSAHDAILVREPNGCILSWNHGAEELYGWTAPEALGQISHSLFQTRFPISRQDMESELAIVGRWEGELVHVRPDGRELVVESRQIVVQGPSTVTTAVLEINRDITERRKWEQIQAQAHTAALAQRAFLQELVDAVPSSLCVVHGRDAKLVLANRAAADVWGAAWQPGQPMQEFLGQNGIRIVDAQGRALGSDVWATLRALRQGQTVLYHEELIQRPAGDRVPVLVNALPLVSANWHSLDSTTEGIAENGAGTPGATDSEPVALVIHQDVSLLKEAERLKDEFITLAAHELRTPIAAILGYAQMLQPRSGGNPGTLDDTRDQHADERLEQWRQEAAESVLQATQRLVALTDDLLDATRLQAGRLELRPEPSDLIALARRVQRRLQGATTRHTLELSTPNEFVVVEIDVGRIEQVLTNLVHNAIKYSPDGGTITITVTEAPAVGGDPRHATVTVHDSGIGIPVGDQARLFARFARAENARTGGIEGTGLGLFLCRELVERHSGRIWFESTTHPESHGTTFYFTLPLVKDETEGNPEAR